jgi:hypothetical protein
MNGRAQYLLGSEKFSGHPKGQIFLLEYLSLWITLHYIHDYIALWKDVRQSISFKNNIYLPFFQICHGRYDVGAWLPNQERHI